jgi:tetratricopeptide (TPR) repeat protein
MTLALAMISNKPEQVKTFIAKYGQYFDKYFITVANQTKAPYYELQKLEDKKLVLNYFKTPKLPEDLDFAAIRNYNHKFIDTDYWFWADDDDDIINPDRLKDLATYCSANNVDVMQLNYDYAQDDDGNAISDHVRERLIATNYEGEWDAPCHETFQGPPCIYEQSEWVAVKHHKDKVDVAKSMLRNKAILEKHFAKTNDPRDAQYLGMTALAFKEPEVAKKFFLMHIERSGSAHDIYRSWCRIAEIEWQLNNFDQGLYATDEAIKVIPEFPDAYHIKVLIYTTSEDYDKAIEWLKVGLSKPVPETLNVIDPTLYSHRALAMGAQSYLFSGRPKQAFKLYQQVVSVAPDFYKSQKKLDGIDWDEVFQSAYFDDKAIDSVKWLLHYTKGESGKPEKLFEALPFRIFRDVRLNGERANFLPTKKWPAKSIVFFTGRGDVPWGPEYLDKDGVGGSEEAVMYLSRELAKLGWQVTVFNEREEEYDDNGVTYKPWTLFNPTDEFDVFVAWRLSGYLNGIKARVKAIDMHDTPIGHATISKKMVEEADKIFFKSNYQAKYVKDLPKTKKVVVGNAIVTEQFA